MEVGTNLERWVYTWWNLLSCEILSRFHEIAVGYDYNIIEWNEKMEKVL